MSSLAGQLEIRRHISTGSTVSGSRSHSQRSTENHSIELAFILKLFSFKKLQSRHYIASVLVV